MPHKTDGVFFRGCFDGVGQQFHNQKIHSRLVNLDGLFGGDFSSAKNKNNPVANRKKTHIKKAGSIFSIPLVT